MGLRGWAILGVAIAAVGWWYSPLSPRVPDAPEVTAAPGALPPPAGANPLCPLPPRVAPGAEPLQSAVPAGLPALRIEGAQLEPLAGFSVDARVLSRHDYASGHEARFSPTDLALGWGRMREDAVLSQLEISQSGRWYHYRWREDAPIPPPEITRSSANMHMVPADDVVAAALRGVRAGERVRIDGWLVRIVDGGWRWQSSLSRTDTGAGACELVYVCGITPL